MSTELSDEEYQERREALIEDAARTKHELEQKQNDALDAIAQGEDLERYEMVSLGELDLEVRAWLPGGVTDTVQKAGRMADSQDLEEVRESMETMLTALDDMTVSEDYNMQFWREYYRRYGPEGLLVAVEVVLGPAQEHMEDTREGMESFPGEQGRGGFRDGVSYDGDAAERASENAEDGS